MADFARWAYFVVRAVVFNWSSEKHKGSESGIQGFRQWPVNI